jgi:hypothetical protein
LLQRRRGLESFETEAHRIEDGEEHFANAVGTVPLLELQLVGDPRLEADLGEKPMNQIHAAVVREVLLTEVDGEFSRSSRALR